MIGSENKFDSWLPKVPQHPTCSPTSGKHTFKPWAQNSNATSRPSKQSMKMNDKTTQLNSQCCWPRTSIKKVDEWGNLSKVEAEIVTLNAKIDILKQKGMKKPEGKSKQEEKKQQDENKKEKKKMEKKKADFRWQKPRANQTKRTVNGKDYYWCANHQHKLTKPRNGVNGFSINLKIAMTNNRSKQTKTPTQTPKLRQPTRYNPMPTWLLSIP